MRKIPTVAIDRGGSKVLINKSDFDPKKHVTWGSEKPSQPVSEETRPEVQSEAPETPQDDWETLAERLVMAGLKRPHPNTKLETLRRRVSEL